MPAHRTTAGWPPARRRRRRLRPSPGPRSHALVSLVSRFLTAEAGACAAIGIGYNRRHLPWLVAAVALAVALCGLAALVRSGTHTAWLAAITAESALVAVGLFRFAYARYLGGTLLAIITLGTLLHPQVSRAFTAGSTGAGQRAAHLGLAGSAAELQGSPAGP